ncbi:EfeM/EfeO family lipoprotein [Amycolatopsis pigmentata]|uniref:EfeM/EfeO family lipoprotein n=1 Tax=Amycolatopsis pigmentata TaxID=450801 RepID=A0ABW5FQ56_9PSEU
MSRWVVAGVAGLVLFLGGGLLFWMRAQDVPAAGKAVTVVNLARSGCGDGWTRARPGEQTLQVHNTDSVTADAALIDPTSGAIFGELEGLAAGQTGELRVTLGNGTYALRCLPDGADATVGPRVVVAGGPDRPGPAAVVPVTPGDLIGPLKAYHDYVAAGLGTLADETSALARTVASGDRPAAQAAWSTAHLSYGRLGAAYGAFGDAGKAIDGTADGLPGGTGDPDFTGFHRLEHGLWHDEPMPALAGVADALDGQVRALRDSAAGLRIDPADLVTRAHEISEDALQSELTGRTDYGSGTGVASALAGLDGTREVLNVLRPVLIPRLPELSEVDAAVTRAETALGAARRPDGSWTPVTRLDRGLRERADGALGALAERLAVVAAVAEPRRTS